MVGLDNPLHIALILVVILLVFGAKRLPEMGRGIGEGMRGFKQAINGETGDGTTQSSAQQSQPLQLSPVAQQPAAAQPQPASAQQPAAAQQQAAPAPAERV